MAAVAVRCLPAMHPAQLWTVPWAGVTVLYALRLLPYKDLRASTATLIVLGSAGFAGGAWFAGRRAARTTPAAVRPELAEQAWWATLGLAAATLTGAALFILQVTESFGLRSALVSSPEVRGAVQDGTTALTVKYVYFALATALLAGIAAAQASTPARRRGATSIVALAALSTYFSTSRSSIFVAVLVGTVGYLVARSRPPSTRQVAVGAVLVGTVGLAALLIGGSIIGKTFQASELSTIDSAFTRHSYLEPLAAPYQYSTTPIGAFNELVAVSPSVGGDAGCATLPLACDLGGAVGMGTSGTDPLRPFTARPIRWNTYTGLDSPVMDGGLALSVPITVLLGLLVGAAWARARQGALVWLIIYSMAGTAAITSTGQNRFFSYPYIGAACIAVMAWYVLGRLTDKRGFREAPL